MADEQKMRGCRPNEGTQFETFHWIETDRVVVAEWVNVFGSPGWALTGTDDDFRAESDPKTSNWRYLKPCAFPEDLTINNATKLEDK